MSKKNSNTKFKKILKVSVNHTNDKGTKSIKCKLSNKQLIDALRMMLLARAIDHKAMIFLRQGKTFFHIAGAGHEAIQAALGLQLDKENDWFFPY